MSERPTLVWFRDDLRLADNPALQAAAEHGAPVAALYVLEDENRELRALGAASHWWLAGSLRALGKDLARAGVKLVLRAGSAETSVPAVAREIGAGAVVWNRRYGHPARIDDRIAGRLGSDGIQVQTFGGTLLYEPNSVLSKSGTPMRVFTPFWKAARASGEPRRPLPAPKRLQSISGSITSDDLASWKLEPTKPDWAGGMRETWTPGEAGARILLGSFIDERLKGYARGRDRPDRESTSRLSPHLRFGEISPHQVWHAAQAALDRGDAPAGDVQRFLTELGWREFSYHLLHMLPDLATRNFQPRFDAFPWHADEKTLRAWQRGHTGYPIVDAGMRELWTTGYMHNRVRMIVASFLTKHLLLDWRAGEQWFWDTLVDADPASNPASWQWVAGSGADAAPYFRIFNPTLQGEKFDPDGDYVRRWVPELNRIEGAAIHQPNRVEAPDYTEPVVDHRKARARALAAFAEVKEG